jgi:hypothetical protein
MTNRQKRDLPVSDAAFAENAKFVYVRERESSVTLRS